MKLFNEEGRLQNFTSRSAGKLDKMSEWEWFKEKSTDHAQILQSSRSDIVEEINWKYRKQLEEKRAKKLTDIGVF